MEQSPQPRLNKKPVLDATMRLQLRSRQKKAAERKRERIDWKAVHKRLAAVEQTDVMSKRDQTALLQARTLEIARPLQTITSTAANPLIVLGCGKLRLALEIEYVSEIITLVHLTKVPGVPKFVAGVVNARGKILTLINLELFLSQNVGDSVEPEQKQSIIVVEAGNFQFGLLCDDFPTICQYDSVAFNEIGSLSLDYQTAHLTGVSSEGVLLLNLASLVTDPAFLVNQD